MPTFSARSRERLLTCDPRLQLLFNEVVKVVDCTIICGYRGQEDQDKAFHDGFSQVKFPDGNHNKFPSLAVDVMPYPIDWADTGIPRLEAFAMAVKETAVKLGIEVEWGGTWRFTDRPHWQVKP